MHMKSISSRQGMFPESVVLGDQRILLDFLFLYLTMYYMHWWCKWMCSDQWVSWLMYNSILFILRDIQKTTLQMRKKVCKKKYMWSCSARCLLHKHDVMQIDVVTNNRLLQETSKKHVRKFLLPPYVSEALNVRRILKPPPCPAACFGYVQDAWWYCTAEGKTVFTSLLWAHITDHWKASPWQFYGSMWRLSGNQGELRFICP